MVLWLNQKEQVSELLFHSLFPLGWARLGASSRQLYYPLLTTESKNMWVFKAAVLNRSRKHMVSKMLITVVLVEI